MAHVVVENQDEERFEIRDSDDVLGVVQYRRRPELIALVHTETSEAPEGEGVASELVRAVLDRLRAPAA